MKQQWTSRRFFGVEKNPDTFDMAVQRIREAIIESDGGALFSSEGGAA